MQIQIMTILEEATRSVPNIDDSALYRQSYWSQTEPPPSRSYHPGYCTVRGETLPMMDYNTESLSSAPFSSPQSTMTNASEDSFILDIYG